MAARRIFYDAPSAQKGLARVKSLSNWYSRKSLPPGANAAFTPQAPVLVQPTEDESVAFAIYRADAIARDIEQRRAEGRERNVDHTKMIAEAMRYAWYAVEKGAWTIEQVDILEARLVVEG